ncbi:MAG TPA: tRNA (adenine(22)-N(1))-methyltransferase TrmK [Candidatus Angelobacter sp.]|jgi:tRNA A22 N-methylase|nr:tRNA (adenine(22)-N(1))-methyltransferase TrmK [Candidatus Angelobacter sp.]
MTTPRLNNRLRALLEMLPPAESIADVGAGHGALAVHLAHRGAGTVIATEAARGPYDELCHNLEWWSARGRVEPRFGADLDPIDAGEVEAVVAAGMGARNLLSICAGAEQRGVRWIALQCIQDAELVEPWIEARGWRVAARQVVADRGHNYPTWIAEVAGR